MDLTHLARLKVAGAQRALVQLVLLMTITGCTTDDPPGVYRESRGEVARYSVEQTDPVLRVALFVKLSDDTVHHPVMYYFQAHKTLIGVRQVEESARLFQSTAPKVKNFIYLPVAEGIDTHLLLLRKSIPKADRQDGKRKAEYEWTDWLLLEIDSQDIAPDKPIILPSFEDLSKREVPEHQQDLLRELTRQYDELKEAAIKRMNTPVKPGDKRPWWTW